jgi:predicted SPOUT superfamily RNA methylase MTH1
LGHAVHVVLPSSVLTVEPPGLPRLLKAYQILRYSSIFGVEKAVFFKDFSTSEKDHGVARAFIEKVWNYYKTPPYLRRKLVPLDRDLRGVGILPPLRLESFHVSKRPYTGQVRPALVKRLADGCFADIGVGEDFYVEGECREGVRQVRVVDPVKKVVELTETKLYMGPEVAFKNSLREVLEEYTGKSFLLATDRRGRIPSLVADAKRLTGKKVVVLFGSPSHDLFEMSVAEGFNLRMFVDDVWNTIPGQKVVTVRTEEALVITLGIVNMLLVSTT